MNNPKKIYLLLILVLFSFILISCQEDKDIDEEELPEEIELVEVDFTKMQNFMYRKESRGAIADVIPYYYNNQFYLYYLYDHRGVLPGEGVPWNLLTTTNFVNYEDHGEVLSRGSQSDPDLYVFTGSVITKDDTHHIFYTGHNPHIGKQAIMHATSSDLVNWEKDKDFTFYADARYYQDVDFRDPYVFYNPDDQMYWMIISAKHKQALGSASLALYKSSDLENWTVEPEPFFQTSQIHFMECPDLFKIGDWWYLIYSDFAATRYVKSKSLTGPWITPVNTQLDGRGYYAAKSFTDGKNRYLFGWIPTKSNGVDNGAVNWGGNLLVHKLSQDENGDLNVSMTEGAYSAFQDLIYTGDQVSISSSDTRNEIEIIDYVLPDSFRLSANIEVTGNKAVFGVLPKVSNDTSDAYGYVFDHEINALNFGYVNRFQTNFSFFNGLFNTLERIKTNKYHIDVFVENQTVTIYVNNQIALSARMYNLTAEKIGFFVNNGSLTVKDIKVYSYGNSK